MVPPSTSAGTSIRRNTVWNFAGIAAPVPAALVAIPLLIKGLGQERFGLLTIAWAVMGYFGVFDLGLSRATVKYVAQACHEGDDRRTGQLFWSSTAAHIVLGLAGGLILAAIAPLLVNTLTAQATLRSETLAVLYLLALSVPIVVLTSVMRGLLEALHRFDLVNAVKLPASLITYVGPLAALTFTTRLPPVVAVIVVSRAAVLVTYLIMCFRVLPPVRQFIRPSVATVVSLATMGGWMTVGTILTPVMVSLDRFVIASAVSVAAVTVYAAPYEVVTKLWMFSASLLGVLFPRFSILSNDRQQLHALYVRGLAWLALGTTPVAIAMILLAPAFFRVWLGADIARGAVPVAQWLTIGVLINVIAQAPATLLQATGHADATGKLQLLQLPIYALMIWVAATRWGVLGVAVAWSLRALLDAVLMFAAARVRVGPIDVSTWKGLRTGLMRL